MSWIFSKELIRSCHSSLEMEEDCSVQKFLDSALLVQWKFKDMHVGFYSNDKMTVHLILSRFGQTLEASQRETISVDNTSSISSELLINLLFPEAFHAKIFRWMVRAKGLMEKIQDSGENTSGWFAKYDLRESTWRTPQCSLLGELTEYSETWPQWGIMLSGVCWELPILGLTTTGKESGFWPTPKMNPTPTSSMVTIQDFEQARYHRSKRPKYSEIVPTPTRRDWKSGKASQKTMEKNSRPLNEVIQHQAGGKLSPMWVEWLMGWPIGWTDLKELETDKSLQQWQEHFLCLIQFNNKLFKQ